MNRTRRVAGLAFVAAICLVIGGSYAVAQAPAAQGQDAGKQQYTMAEYNAYQAAAAEKNPTQQIKLLDDFVSKYPNSALLIYIYPLYFNAYSQLKNWPKVIEYSDKLIALGEGKVEPPVRYQAYYARAFAYSNMPPNNPDVQAQAPKACEAAKAGLKTLNDLKKPDNMSEEDFNKQKQQPATLFNYTIAQCSMVQKDYQTAIDSYKTVLEKTPDDCVTAFKIGQAYAGMNPPRQMDAFWYYAKAAGSKCTNQQQATQVKTYLRKLIANYQGGNVCDSLIDAELNEVLQLASTTADRPETYKLPASADLDAARQNMTIASVIGDLKAGGDKAKVTWLASCGLEFPDVPGKLIEVTAGSDVQLKVAFVTSDAEFDSKTTPDMDVKVVGQPEAAKLEKDNPVRFTGTLVAFDPDPNFMLHWDKAKVNAEDIPKDKEKKAPTKKRPATKKPGRG